MAQRKQLLQRNSLLEICTEDSGRPNRYAYPICTHMGLPHTRLTDILVWYELSNVLASDKI